MRLRLGLGGATEWPWISSLTIAEDAEELFDLMCVCVFV